MLNGLPLANPDPFYTTGKNSVLTVPFGTGVITNDFDAEGSNLTATRITNGANGNALLNGDGSFTYTPNTNFVGIDSFTYRVTDGVGNSEVAKVSIAVGRTFSDRLNSEERGSNNVLHTGGLPVYMQFSSINSLVYRADTVLPQILVPLETIYNGAPVGSTLTSIVAQLTFGGQTQAPVTYSSAVGSLAAGSALRFAMHASASGVATGMYDWSIILTANFSNGAQPTTATYSGKQAVVNRATSDFGKGWWLDGYDRLFPQANGALLVASDGSTRWFEWNGSSYNIAEGDLTFSTLSTTPTNTFVLTDKWGNLRRYNASGFLHSTKHVNNIANSFTYGYTGTKLTSITDEFNRDAALVYGTTAGAQSEGKLISFTDQYGRAATFTYGSTYALPTVCTWVDPNNVATSEDPDPISITFCGYGTNDMLTSLEDPQNNVETYEYDDLLLLKKVTRADATTWQLFPGRKEGYKTGAANNVFLVSQKNARFIDERGKTFSFETDRFGNVIRFTDARSAISNWEYSPKNELYRVTEADPDGAGLKTRPVTKLGYNGLGDLLKVVNPDGTSRAYTYHSTLHLVLTASNELSQVDTFTYDSVGNMLTSKDAANNVWTYTYDQTDPVPANRHGRLLSVTSPDPDGPTLPLLPIVTNHEYETTFYSRLKKSIFVNGNNNGTANTTQQFTYDNNDNLLSTTDELGRVTTTIYDNLDRLRFVTLNSTNATYTYKYNRNSQISKVTDPNQNFTEYFYNIRKWVQEVRQMDPDGAGPRSRPSTTYLYDGTGNVISLVRPEFKTGVSQTFAYNDNGQLELITGPTAGESYSTNYDLLGRELTSSDSSGRLIKYDYDSRSRLTKIEDHDVDGAGPKIGPTTLYGYDNASRMISVADPLGRVTSYGYTANGWLENVTLPDPDSTGPAISPVYSYLHDALGRRTQVTDPLNRQTKFEYNNRHWLKKTTTPNASIFTTYDYYDSGTLKQVNEPLGRSTVYQYDNLDQLQTLTLPDPDGAGLQYSSPVYTYDFDDVGNLMNRTDALGRVTSYLYDGLNRIETITEANPGTGSPVWQYEYDDDTLLYSSTDPMNHVTTHGYDNAGRHVAMIMPDPDGIGPLTSEYAYGYDTLNRLTSVTSPDPDGFGGQGTPISTYGFDIYSRLQSEMDPLGKQTTYSYNDAHELVSLTDPNGNATRWGYDRLGRTSLETNSQGNTQAFEYDAVGNIVRSTDRNRRIITYSPDLLDRMTDEVWYSATTAEAISTTLTQGSSGTNEVQKIEIWNIQNGTFRLTFEGETTAPISYTASAATVKTALEGLAAIDNVTVTLTNGTGVRTYTITFGGILAGTNVSQINGAVRSGGPSVEERALHFDYDAASRMFGATDPSGTYAFTFDNLDRVSSETQSFSNIGLTPQIKLERLFDSVGNRTSLKASLVDIASTTKDFVNSYYFDALNRLTRVDQTAQGGAGSHAVADKRVNLTYNALGQFLTINRFENLAGTNPAMRTAYTYDDANRLSEIAHRNISSGGTPTLLARYQYSFDALNRITSITSFLDGGSNYNYDSRSQLLTANHTAPRPAENFSFDNNGNRNMNGYTQGTNNQTTGDGTYTYLYDKEGNRTRRTKVSDSSYEEYTWDHRNRLTKVTFKNSANTVLKTVDYNYDVFNRLVKRSYDSNGPGAGGVTNTFLVGYDGINPTLAFDGGTTADVSNRFLWGQMVDQLFADEQITNPSSAGNTLWALGDHLGTIRDLVDFNGTTYSITNHRVYDSFGRLTSETNAAVDMVFAYTGKYFDEITQLSNHWNRWYDPQSGKWISEDPIGFAAGDANLSRYVINSVTRFVDSDGLDIIVPPLLEKKSAFETTAEDIAKKQYETLEREIEDYRRKRIRQQIAEMKSYEGSYSYYFGTYLGMFGDQAPRVDSLDNVLYYGGKTGRVVGVTAGAAVTFPVSGTVNASSVIVGGLVIAYEVDQSQAAVRSIISDEQVETGGSTVIKSFVGDGNTGKVVANTYDFAGAIAAIHRLPSVVGNLLKSTDKTRRIATKLREDSYELIVVKDGRVIARSHQGLSHQELINRQLGGVLPEGASVGTIGKLDGEIIVLPSTNFPNNRPSLADTNALKEQFE
ncbi:MAG: Ig-like domain-containing protein [Pirellulaceae bacterium]